MNEEKLKQILNKIGQTEVPAEAARIAEQTSQRFTATINLPQPRFVTSLRLLAAAAVIAVAFVAGRLSNPTPSINSVTYTPAISVNLIEQKKENSFWQQKVLAAMKQKPFAQSSNFTSQLNAYKQYLKEKRYE